MNAEIIHGDCLDVMRGMADASVDAIVTDPPYGLEGMAGGYGRRHRTIANDNDLSALSSALPELRRVLRLDAWSVFFCAPSKRTQTEHLLGQCGFAPFGEIVWDKGSPSLGYHIRYAHETVVVCRIGNPARPPEPILSVLRVPRAKMESGHPHEKPVSLLRTLVRWVCPVGGLVLDPFAGTGTTGLACIAERRRHIGIEWSREWATFAARRLGNHWDDMPIFVA